jgi:hypothetical protein
MLTLADYLRGAAIRFPTATLPRHRKLEELCRDGAHWARQQPNFRWLVIDEAAADRALGLIPPQSTQVAA